MVWSSLRKVWKLLLVVVLCGPPQAGWGWGGQVHRWVNAQACQHLPSEMNRFQRWAGVLSAQASDADHRKASDILESPRHWIDIDHFPEFSRGHLSHDLDSLRLKHGHWLDVYGNGVVPWVIAGVTETLAVSMAQGNWPEVIRRAADLGHYVADVHQPLHTTKNYDGQLTGNEGIHLRYEIDMVDRNLDQMACEPGQVSYLDDPLECIFATIPGTWSYVDSIMAADRQARKRSPSYDDEYYQVLWDRTGQFTREQICRAVQILADLWYTAWVNAGRPEFPPASPPEPISRLGESPHLLGMVTVQGVVTIGSGVLGEDPARIFIQDESGRGILVCNAEAVEPIGRGDLVQVEGTVHDHRGITQMLNPSATILGRGCAQPDAQVLSTGAANDPRWENTLIAVRGRVVFTLEDEDWSRLHLDDGSGAIVVLVHQNTGIDLAAIGPGDLLTVAGVGTYLLNEKSYAILPAYQDQVQLSREILQRPNAEVVP